MPFTVVLTETPGRCRWCGCTDRDPCAEGCGWANARHTLCTACATLDQDVRSVRGRRRIADDRHSLEAERELEARRRRVRR